MGQLEGRRAVVTGASRGMGRRMAEALVREGATVALMARPSEQLDSIAEALGEKALVAPCDLADPLAVNAAFARVASAWGELDILVNNAGALSLGSIEAATDEQIARQVGVNLMGPIYTARAAIPLLRRSGRGDIVNVSSESVKMPIPYLSIYAAAKAGLEVFTAGLRSELRSDLIRVTALRSGYVAESELGREWDPVVTKAWRRTVRETGHLQLSGTQPAPPEAMAAALVHVLTLPRDITVDLLEVRPTAP